MYPEKRFEKPNEMVMAISNEMNLNHVYGLFEKIFLPFLFNFRFQMVQKIKKNENDIKK